MSVMKQEVIKQANELCRRKWIISGLGHNLVMCTLAKYQEQGIKLEDMTKPCYVRIPIAKLLSGQKWTSGGNQYKAIARMVKATFYNAVIFEHEKNWDLLGIFYSRVRIDKETNEIICSLNPEMYKYWLELTGNYAKLRLDKVLQLPLNTTAHLLYQCLMSYRYKNQCELDFEEFKCEIACSKMDTRDFVRHILVKYQKEFTEKDILRWEYELIRGRYKKITKIRILFPEKAKPTKTEVEKKKKKENWGWIEKQDPEVVEMAYEARDNGTYPDAINRLSAILNGTPPEEREQTLIEFKATLASYKHQQRLF